MWHPIATHAHAAKAHGHMHAVLHCIHLHAVYIPLHAAITRTLVIPPRPVPLAPISPSPPGYCCCALVPVDGLQALSHEPSPLLLHPQGLRNASVRHPVPVILSAPEIGSLRE